VSGASRRISLRALALGLGGLFAGACPSGDDGDDGGVEPDFPEDYAERYTEVRNCRGSGDHDLHNIRILVDPSGREAYEGRTVPFPEGAVVLKEEYDFGDVTCEGPIKQWTVMRRLPDGSSPDTLDWAWQRVDLQREVVEEDAARCIGCHQSCGQAPDGYGWTCAMP
jgi:hypothetical protein